MGKINDKLGVGVIGPMPSGSKHLFPRVLEAKNIPDGVLLLPPPYPMNAEDIVGLNQEAIPGHIESLMDARGEPEDRQIEMFIEIEDLIIDDYKFILINKSLFII